MRPIAAAAVIRRTVWRRGVPSRTGQSPIAAQPRTPSVIVPDFHLAYSRTQVKNRTETLEIGTHVPDFSLGAANREGTFTLGDLLAGSKLILEFLRGTW